MMFVWSKRGDYQNCSVLYCVLKLCTVISTLRWAVLTVLGIGFCLTGPISQFTVRRFICVCVYLCVFVSYCIVVVSTVGWTWWDWSLILWTCAQLQCFDTVGWVIWPVKPVPDMTYNVFGGTLSLTQSITLVGTRMDSAARRMSCTRYEMLQGKRNWFLACHTNGGMVVRI